MEDGTGHTDAAGLKLKRNFRGSERGKIKQKFNLDVRVLLRI